MQVWKLPKIQISVSSEDSQAYYLEVISDFFFPHYDRVLYVKGLCRCYAESVFSSDSMLYGKFWNIVGHILFQSSSFILLE